MSESSNIKKHVARNAWNKVFELLGGEDHLLAWAKDHPTEYYKIFAKLAPPIKEDKGLIETHDQFIKMIMAEEQRLLAEQGKPIKLIDVPVDVQDMNVT